MLALTSRQRRQKNISRLSENRPQDCTSHIIFANSRPWRPFGKNRVGFALPIIMTFDVLAQNLFRLSQWKLLQLVAVISLVTIRPSFCSFAVSRLLLILKHLDIPPKKGNERKQIAIDTFLPRIAWWWSTTPRDISCCWLKLAHFERAIFTIEANFTFCAGEAF